MKLNIKKIALAMIWYPMLGMPLQGYAQVQANSQNSKLIQTNNIGHSNNIKIEQASAVTNQKLSEIKDNVLKSKLIPEDLTKDMQIMATPINGIYEVLFDKTKIIYTNETGKYFFTGNLIFAHNGEPINLTQQKIDELSKFDITKLNFKNAIKTIYGTGKNKIVTFEDPNCPYCHKLHAELQGLTNATVYTFIIPILGPKSTALTTQIWCSSDPSKSWNDHMKGLDIEILTKEQEKDCNLTPINDNLAFAKDHNIFGTPAIFFENGEKLNGFAPLEKLKETMHLKGRD